MRGAWIKRMCLLVGCVFLTAVSGCSTEKTPEKVSKTGFYLDTIITVSAYGTDAAVVEGAVNLCGDYEKILSKTIAGSDVWNINHAQGRAVEVSEDTAQIIAMANRVSEMTGGIFDITVAPAVALWDFTGNSAALPEASALEEAVKLIDYTKIQIDGNTVTLPNGMAIDLGGIAKGYIADRVVDYLRENGVESALVNLGGNVVTLGEKPEGVWKIGIQDPQSDSSEAKLMITGNDLSIVTSGVYERGFTLDGVRYHHILDTKTGWPVQNGVASLTILTEKSFLADALSTAVFVLGVEDGLDFVNAYDGVEAIFITDDGTCHYSRGAQAYLLE